MKEMVKVVNEALQDAQKDTSRSISPYVKAKMRPGYQVRRNCLIPVLTDLSPP